MHKVKHRQTASVTFLAITLLDINSGNQIFLFLDITLSLTISTLYGSLDPNYGENCPRLIDLPGHSKLSKAVSGQKILPIQWTPATRAVPSAPCNVFS